MSELTIWPRIRETMSRLSHCPLIFLIPGILSAATLEVGPGKQFAEIEAAHAAAQAGDHIIVFPAAGGVYRKTAVLVRTPCLTFRGAARDGERVKLSGKGFDYSGAGSVPRAIFQFGPGADGCVLEGFDLSGARNASHNGAGVRIHQANDVTIRDCEIHDNDMGLMSNGDGSGKTGARQRIENCLIHHNGSAEDPGYNHNLYLGGASVLVQGCHIHTSTTGHNVKSRAGFTAIVACFIHDSANREFDLVDAEETARAGAAALLAGNLIVKDPGCRGNRTVIHYGKDGEKTRTGPLTLVNNTVLTPFSSPVIDLSSPGTSLRLLGNVLGDPANDKAKHTLVAVRNGADLAKVTGSGNLLSPGFAPLPPGLRGDRNRADLTRAWFRDSAGGDWHPAGRVESPGRPVPWEPISDVPDFVGGVKGGAFTLALEFRAPVGTIPRPEGDAAPGAFSR